MYVLNFRWKSAMNWSVCATHYRYSTIVSCLIWLCVPEILQMRGAEWNVVAEMGMPIGAEIDKTNWFWTRVKLSVSSPDGMGGWSINHNRCQVFTPVWEQTKSTLATNWYLSKLSNFLKGKHTTRCPDILLKRSVDVECSTTFYRDYFKWLYSSFNCLYAF